jgi:nucleoside-diphosphate-sugar epimerase
VLRLAGIYGPGRTRLIDQVRSGTARCPEGQSPWSNRVHRDDAAGMIAHLLALGTPRPTYLGVDDEPAPLCDVYRFVAELLQVPPPASGPVAARERSNKRCSNRWIRESGYRCRYPTYREGYRAMIATS